MYPVDPSSDFGLQRAGASSNSTNDVKKKRLMTRKELPAKDSERRSRPVLLASSRSEVSDEKMRVRTESMRL